MVDHYCVVPVKSYICPTHRKQLEREGSLKVQHDCPDCEYAECEMPAPFRWGACWLCAEHYDQWSESQRNLKQAGMI